MEVGWEKPRKNSYKIKFRYSNDDEGDLVCFRDYTKKKVPFGYFRVSIETPTYMKIVNFMSEDFNQEYLKDNLLGYSSRDKEEIIKKRDLIIGCEKYCEKYKERSISIPLSTREIVIVLYDAARDKLERINI